MFRVFQGSRSWALLAGAARSSQRPCRHRPSTIPRRPPLPCPGLPRPVAPPVYPGLPDTAPDARHANPGTPTRERQRPRVAADAPFPDAAPGATVGRRPRTHGAGDVDRCWRRQFRAAAGRRRRATSITRSRSRHSGCADAGYNNNRPDRAEFFYGKCGCFRVSGEDPRAGPPLTETSVDYRTSPATSKRPSTTGRRCS
jgi:hypothetical protein